MSFVLKTLAFPSLYSSLQASSTLLARHLPTFPAISHPFFHLTFLLVATATMCNLVARTNRSRRRVSTQSSPPTSSGASPKRKREGDGEDDEERRPAKVAKVAKATTFLGRAWTSLVSWAFSKPAESVPSDVGTPPVAVASSNRWDSVGLAPELAGLALPIAAIHPPPAGPSQTAPRNHEWYVEHVVEGPKRKAALARFRLERKTAPRAGYEEAVGSEPLSGVGNLKHSQSFLKRKSDGAVQKRLFKSKGELARYKRKVKEEHERQVEEEKLRLAKEAAIKSQPLIREVPIEILTSLPKVHKLLPSHQIAKFGRTPITVKDLQTLKPLDWLNDEIINGFLTELCEKAKSKLAEQMKTAGTPIKDDIPRYHALNTHWFPEMQQPDGVKKIARWTKRQKIGGKNLLSVHKLFIPIHRGSHWTLLTILPQRRQVRWYDSLFTSEGPVLASAKEMLQHELGDAWDESEWTFERAESGHQQNSSDCGAFTLMNAWATFYTDNPPDILPDQHGEAMRQLIGSIILHGGLKGDFDLEAWHGGFHLETPRNVSNHPSHRA
ncbi:cysteine proteinase [Microthyrium microscopicum]|uniref:Cysteine proteinase n=1 Tax=Microthyrium microscopicum TaxID=703497 RepID=A0A6A6UMP2_9PEZI|nr:cysteine proteinase [Microthyrium microscopicum]